MARISRAPIVAANAKILELRKRHKSYSLVLKTEVEYDWKAVEFMERLKFGPTWKA